MQAFTHFLFGLWIGQWFPGFLGYLLTFVSHIPLDIACRGTYHPPQARWKDPFWVWSHFLFLVLAVEIAVRWWREWPVMLASVGPDVFDWWIRKPFDPEGRWEIHAFIRWASERTTWIPDWTLEHHGLIPELLLGLIVYWLIL